MTALIELDGVSLRAAQVTILENVSFAVASHESIALLGPSGAGKTSLVRIVLGLAAPSRGVVRIEGKVASEAGRVLVPPHERGFGALFQDLALWPHLSVAENVAFGLREQGVPDAELKRRVAEALAATRLGDHRERGPATLSGGEQRRLALARAIVTEPKLLALDEAFANLDVLIEQDMLDLVDRTRSKKRQALLLVTHDLRHAKRLSQRAIVLEAGAVTADVAIAELRRSPPTDFTRALVARDSSPA